MALELEQTARTQEQARLEAAYEQAQKVKAAGIARGARVRGQPVDDDRGGVKGHYMISPDGRLYLSSR
jgi:hypothetical protein